MREKAPHHVFLKATAKTFLSFVEDLYVPYRLSTIKEGHILGEILVITNAYKTCRCRMTACVKRQNFKIMAQIQY